MAENDLDASLDARVLICDPKRKILPDVVDALHRRFGGVGLSPSPIPKDSNRFKVESIEVTVVDNLDEVVGNVRDRTAPYYSLIVYEVGQINTEGSAGKISNVNKHDFFIPQMVFGDGLKPEIAGKSARAGVRYFASDSEGFYGEINHILRNPTKLPNVTVVKVGGSSFDFNRQRPDSYNLGYVCDELIRIHQDRSPYKKQRRVNRIIVTAGAGQYGDLVKEWLIKFGHKRIVIDEYPKSMAKALQTNLDQLKTLFGDVSAILTTGSFYYIGKGSTSRRIPLIGTAPHYIMAKYGIPLQDSDTHTIALAEFYGAEIVILIKRTDGIYSYDPMRGFVLNPKTGECADLERWKEAQKDNTRYDSITVDDMLNGHFSREGTGVDGKADGSSGHLIEDSALRFMLSYCKNLNEIVVVHIAPEEMNYQIGENQYKHIVTGEELTLPATGWRGVLEQNIRDAFQGRANSKIVKW